MASTKSNILKKKLLSALTKHMGIVTTACEAVGVNRSAHYNLLKRDADYAAAVKDIEERSIDFVESKLFSLIQGAKIPETKAFVIDGKIITETWQKQFEPDNTSIIFYLKTKAKHRGYVERQESSLVDKNGNDVKPIMITGIFPGIEKNI
jgi:hypothetical protein